MVHANREDAIERDGLIYESGGREGDGASVDEQMRDDDVKNGGWDKDRRQRERQGGE